MQGGVGIGREREKTLDQWRLLFFQTMIENIYNLRNKYENWYLLCSHVLLKNSIDKKDDKKNNKHK